MESNHYFGDATPCTSVTQWKLMLEIIILTWKNEIHLLKNTVMNTSPPA